MNQSTNTSDPVKSFEDYMKEHPYPVTSSFSEDEWNSNMFEKWYGKQEDQLRVNEDKTLLFKFALWYNENKGGQISDIQIDEFLKTIL